MNSQKICSRTCLWLSYVMGSVFWLATSWLAPEPIVQTQRSIWGPPPAYGQTPEPVTDQELRNYAQALLTIEPFRQAAFNQIKQLMGTSELPNIACHQRQSLEALDENIRLIAQNYCHESKKIVERNNLTISRFNTITLQIQKNPSLQERVRTELLQLQTP